MLPPLAGCCQPEAMCGVLLAAAAARPGEKEATVASAAAAVPR